MTARITQIVIGSDSGVVDEDVEAAHLADCLLDLLCVGHVEHQRRYAFVGDVERSASSCVHPLCSALQGFLDECTADAAIGAGNQDCFLCDVHDDLLLGLTFAGPILPLYWVKPAGVPKLIGDEADFFFLMVFLRDNYWICCDFSSIPYRFVNQIEPQAADSIAYRQLKPSPTFRYECPHRGLLILMSLLRLSHPSRSQPSTPRPRASAVIERRQL